MIFGVSFRQPSRRTCRKASNPDAKVRQGRHSATKTIRDAVAGLSPGDPAKTLVMMHFGQLVADGFAEWEMFGDGALWLHLNTGETFLLAETAIIRIA